MGLLKVIGFGGCLTYFFPIFTVRSLVALYGEG
jgi:hypothetical protein